MTNYKTTELGKIDEIINLENGKVFLHDTLELTSCEISINTVPKGFYEHLGFKVYKRSEIDEQGNPYPILYMRLKG